MTCLSPKWDTLPPLYRSDSHVPWSGLSYLALFVQKWRNKEPKHQNLTRLKGALYSYPFTTEDKVTFWTKFLVQLFPVAWFNHDSLLLYNTMQFGGIRKSIEEHTAPFKRPVQPQLTYTNQVKSITRTLSNWSDLLKSLQRPELFWNTGLINFYFCSNSVLDFV